MRFYINSTVAVLSRCSYKLGSNYKGVYDVVRLHAHFLGFCVHARAVLCVCMRTAFRRRAWVCREICR